jgi:hypothetical protein
MNLFKNKNERTPCHFFYVPTAITRVTPEIGRSTIEVDLNERILDAKEE